MTSSVAWKEKFSNWPISLPRRGVVISSLNESMPFRNFWVENEMLLLERTTPDALGGRFILLSFDIINSLRFIDPLSESMIAEAGFADPLAVA